MSAHFFLCLCVSVPFTCPRGDWGPRKEDRCVGGRGKDLVAGLTGCNGGIDERPREEGFFANLSPPIFGKTEVTWEQARLGWPVVPPLRRPA
jgi:hypothetical protein